MKRSKWNPEGKYRSPIKDVDEFYERTRAVGGAEAVALAKAAVAWVEGCKGGKPVPGGGKVRGPLYLTVPDQAHDPVKILAIDTDGAVYVNYNHMDGHPPYSDVNERLRLNHLLNAIDRVSIDDDVAVRCSWANVGLDELQHNATRSAFFRVFDGVAARLSGQRPPPAR